MKFDLELEALNKRVMVKETKFWGTTKAHSLSFNDRRPKIFSTIVDKNAKRFYSLGINGSKIYLNSFYKMALYFLFDLLFMLFMTIHLHN